MPGTWIVVADAARARVFEAADRTGELRERHALTHPESQLHDRDLRTGGKGEVIQRLGAGTNQSDPQETTMEKHAERFAKEVAAFLKQARVNGDFDELVLAAAPRELGRLRDNLDGATAKTVRRTVDKNLTEDDADGIREKIGLGD